MFTVKAACVTIEKTRREVMKMRVEELKSKSTEELLAMVNDAGLAYARSYTREDLIEILKTLPEDDDTKSYIDKADVGMLVAFRTDKMKVKSAKIVKKSSKDKKLLLETKYGAQFLADYNDIVWVNTTGRWPRWVFKLMKGLEC